MKAKACWSTVKEKAHLYKRFLREFGSRFYQQEIINATKAVQDCQFFVAPGHATHQTVQMFKDQLVNVVVGSAKLLVFESIDQAVIDFDLAKGTFNFIDREDLHIKREVLLDYMVASGAMYNRSFTEGRDTK